MPHADLVLYNARIRTLDPRRPAAEALAAAGGRVVLVGTDEAALSLVGPGTLRLNGQGHLVLPGLVDSHIHFASWALARRQVDLTGARTLAEALERVRTAAERVPPGQWVVGRGWDHSDWEGGRLPSRTDLDRVIPDRPVVLTRKDGHSIWVNSLALARAGIDRGTPDPPGGVIDRDEHGEPVGILREAPAMRLVWQAVGRPGADVVESALAEAVREAHRLGLTGVHEIDGREAFQAYQWLSRAGRLTLRVRFFLNPAHELLEPATRLGVMSGFGDDWVKIAGVKLFADGSLGSLTALMLEPYEGTADNFGVAVTPPEQLRAWVEEASRAGLAVAIHAIGDRANRVCLDILEATRHLWADRGLRPRIEHVQLLHPADLPRLARIGVVASMQPVHCTQDLFLAERHWGARSRYGYAWRSLLDQGTVLAFGSDCPVETLDPFRGLFAAVTRQREDGYPPGGWYPEERLDIESAVRAYTFGAAFAVGEEGHWGALRPGSYADLLVLSRDIFAVAPEELLGTRVLATVVGGRLVYTDPAFGP